MSTTLKLTVPAMVDFLTSIGTNSQFFSAVTTTAPKLLKSCPFKGVLKKTVVKGWLNIDYKKAVEKLIAASAGVPASEVEYIPADSWHMPYMPDGKMTPIRVNKTKQDGKFYLFYYPAKSKKKEDTQYVDETGKEIAYEDLKPYFYATSPKSEFKPTVRTVTLNNIERLKARGLIVVKR
jgi:hypothetical protein